MNMIRDIVISGKEWRAEIKEFKDSYDLILGLSEKPEIIKDISRGYIIGLVDRVYSKHGSVSSDNLTDYLLGDK